MASETNPLGLLGIEFTEFATPDNDFMHKVFLDFGFSMLKKHKEKDIYYYQQNDINFLMTETAPVSRPVLPSLTARPSPLWAGAWKMPSTPISTRLSVAPRPPRMK